MNYNCIQNQNHNFPAHNNCNLFAALLDETFWTWELTGETISRELLDFTFEFIKKTSKMQIRDGVNCRLRIQIINNKLYATTGDDSGEFCERQLYWLEILKNLSLAVQLPDCDFIINLEDYPAINKYSAKPVFSLCKTASHEDFLLPNFFSLPDKIDKINWDQKKNQAVWRGSSTGGTHRFGTWRKSPRSYLVQIKSELLDARYTAFTQIDKISQKDIAKKLQLADYLDFDDQCQYKYMLQVDGNTTAWRYLNLLNSNSLVFKQESPFYEFYYPLLKPFKHFVPLGYYCEDIITQINWANNNPEKAQEKAIASQKLVTTTLSLNHFYCYLFNLISRYARLLNFKVTPNSGSLRIK